MFNERVMRAWPNWLIIPAIVLFWVFVGVEVSELFTNKTKGGANGLPV